MTYDDLIEFEALKKTNPVYVALMKKFRDTWVEDATMFDIICPSCGERSNAASWKYKGLCEGSHVICPRCEARVTELKIIVFAKKKRGNLNVRTAR